MDKLLKHFEGNRVKAYMWLDTENPLLGDIKPIELIILGKAEQVDKFIDNCLEGELP